MDKKQKQKQKQPLEVSDKKRKNPKGSSKKKNEGSSSQKPPSPEASTPSSPVSYPVPLNHRKKWYIGGDVGNSVDNYGEIIVWLRTMACIDGSVFEDIQSSHCSKGNYPLLEIEVINPDHKSVKFIIKKTDLYLIGCSVNNVKFQFKKTGYNIDGFETLEYYDGRYTSEPWKVVGPKPMINSINILNGLCVENDININKVEMKPYIQACEVFYVHLCEAIRMRVIQSVICKTLLPMYNGDALYPTYVEEEKDFLLGPGGSIVKESDDIYSLLKDNGPLDENLSNETPACINVFIHSYKQLCKAWLTYSLAGKKHLSMDPQKVLELNLRSIKSLRCSLGIIGTTNLNKILEEWETKMTIEDYNKIKEKICDLYAQDQVIDYGKEENDS